MCRKMEELQTAPVAGAQKVWDFLGQTETTLMPLGFSPLCSGEPVREVSIVLPMLESTSAKMQSLEKVVSEQLEAEGHVLAKKVAKHMLMCFRRWDPNVSLEPVVQGPTVETEEATRDNVQEVAKIVVARFHR
jgi:hypothetical protein